MREIPLVGSVMTPSPRSIEIDASLRAADDLMTDHEVRHLLVTESGELVGIVSDRDLAFSDNAPDASLADSLRVRDVCSLDVYTITREEPLDVVLEQMANRRIGSAVVMEDDKIAGVFTATDACRCFAQYLRGESSE
jgi:CBS domain-containing protein